MKKTWIKRIEKLESALQSRTRTRTAVVFRYGYVQHLPAGSLGERHIAISTNESTVLPNVEQCAFEERLGASPDVHDELAFTVHLHAEDGT